MLAEEESEIDHPQIYNGKIYYSTEIVENVVYRTMQDGKEQMVEEEDTVGIRLNRMELSGPEKKRFLNIVIRKQNRNYGEQNPFLAVKL